MTSVVEPLVAASEQAGLPLVELRNGPLELIDLLVECAERGDALNAFLIAAGLRQLVEDLLEPDVLRLGQIDRALGSVPYATRALRLARTATAGSHAVHLGRRHRLRGFDAALEQLLEELAGVALSGEVSASMMLKARRLQDNLPHDADLLRQRLRPPACFRGFDQHPDDVRELVGRLVARGADPGRPVAVVGLRTSGSYLAPLAAAELRARGYTAEALTTRPCLHLPAAKRQALRRVLRAGGLVALIDDPPGSGKSIEHVARAIERLGGDRESIVLMLALFGDGLPPALAERPAVLLPWDEWSVHDRLEPAAVRDALARLRPDLRQLDVARVALADEPGRGHVSARYAVGGEEIFVRGAGIGYFGDHAAAVAQRLGPHVPAVHGVDEGLLFREWLPEERRPARLDPDAVAAYAAARVEHLALTEDSTGGLTAQDPVWETAGQVAARAFGRGSAVARLAATDRAMRSLLRAERPSLVDGLMLADAFFTSADGSTLVKAKPDERSFSNRDLACCDGAFDAAAAAVLNELDAEALRTAFEEKTGAPVDRDRWLLYELVALDMAEFERMLPRSEVRRRSARAVQRWFAMVYLRDLPRPDYGGFCALDIDGVLETETLGFPSLSPASAQALRTLIAHGYRPVLASGRSIGEIAERSVAYGLLGGVAEYGAALYDARTGEARSLVSPGAAAALERARSALEAMPGVTVGSDHQHSIRAWETDDGTGRPLGGVALAAARTAAAPAELTCVRCDEHTDLVPAEVDKGRGLRALVELLEPDPERRVIELAVGDAEADLPMFAVAERAVAPRNAEPAVRMAGMRVLRRGYQRGLADAVRELVGHGRGSCPRCAVADHDTGRALLLTLFSARERGSRSMIAGAARVWRLRRKLDSGR